MVGIERTVEWRADNYPRDYCATYRKIIFIDNNLQFTPISGAEFGLGSGGGYSIAVQIWNSGYETRMVSVEKIRSKIAHIAHGTAAVRKEKPLKYEKKQKKLEARTAKFLDQQWIKDLEQDDSLDR